MAKSVGYGKFFPDFADYLIGLCRSKALEGNTLYLALWILPRMRDGNHLKEREADILKQWLESEEKGIKAGSVQCVQFSYVEAAREVFNSNKTEAQRQTYKLLELRFLERVGDYGKGHAQLYIVFPDKYTSDEGECVPNDNEKVHTDSGIGTHFGEIGTHREAVTSGVISYPDTIQNTNQEGAIDSARTEAEQSPSVCPFCGSSERLIQFDNMMTCSCGCSWRVTFSS